MSFLAVLGLLLCGTCAGYTVLAAWLTARRPIPSAYHGELPPVTVLKPLCGDEPGLEDNLRSYFEQQYPHFQLVFGVLDPRDAALAVVQRLQAQYPQVDALAVVETRTYGDNLKVSNLINMLAQARHDVLVVADSDIHVQPQHLRSLLPALSDPQVGLVTCLYYGIPRGGFWSRVGALFIEEWFTPSVRVAKFLGSNEFAFGATIALRRATLERIGSFHALSNHLADDYWLGALVREQGLHSDLSVEMVSTDITERSFLDLARHELRWLRTIRLVRPWGYLGAFITLGWPVGALGVALSHGAASGWALLALTIALRLQMHYNFGLDTRKKALSDFVALLVRDPLTMALWCFSFVSRRIRWRHIQFVVEPDGSFRKTI